MKISLTEVTNLMKQALQAKGYPEQDIPFLIEMYLGGELRGHPSHGLASFPSFISHDFSDLAEPEVIKETPALFMLDAKSNPGTIVGKRAADEAIARAKKEAAGVAVAPPGGFDPVT